MGAVTCPESPRRRAGFTVLEALVALILLGMLLYLCGSLATAQRRSATRLTARTEALAGERTLWWVLSTELRSGTPGRDWTVPRSGVVALRAFRGRGLVCAPTAAGSPTITVRHRGPRRPDPAKDSVLLLDARGRWKPAKLVASDPAGGACVPLPSERVERWTLDPVPDAPVVLARVFERGSYHLEDEAFRYRRGRGGRQPLTPEVMDPSGSSLRARGSGVELRFRARPFGTPGGVVRDSGWVRSLGGRR